MSDKEPKGSKPFDPHQQTVSKMRPYSMGVVAQNKVLTSTIIEVVPVEDFTMLDGELSANTMQIKASGNNDDGSTHKSSVDTKVSIQAEWLPVGGGNRFTAPDVRRGAIVMIYQFADTDKYYWVLWKQDLQLRKLETVIYAYSATEDESKPTDHTSTYYFEISTHSKLVTFHTSNVNKEFCQYDIQLDTGNGILTIQDSVGNSFILNSKTSYLALTNNKNSSLIVDGENVNLTAAKTMTINGQQVEIKGPSGVFVEGPLTKTGDSTTAGVSTFAEAKISKMTVDSINANSITSGSYSNK